MTPAVAPHTISPPPYVFFLFLPLVMWRNFRETLSYDRMTERTRVLGLPIGKPEDSICQGVLPLERKSKREKRKTLLKKIDQAI